MAPGRMPPPAVPLHAQQCKCYTAVHSSALQLLMQNLIREEEEMLVYVGEADAGGSRAVHPSRAQSCSARAAATEAQRDGAVTALGLAHHAYKLQLPNAMPRLRLSAQAPQLPSPPLAPARGRTALLAAVLLAWRAAVMPMHTCCDLTCGECNSPVRTHLHRIPGI